jgi:tRNA pseudouridine32 synthase / 23S rRNA pseudouridine746 synthase
MPSASCSASDPPPPDGLRVVFADDDLVVVDKPPGMPSVPARTASDPPAVAVMLALRYGPLEAVHRLDRDTSGLLVLARSHAARRSLGRAFESAAVSKRYHAVVRGALPADAGAIHLPLAADPARAPRQRVDPILGRRATTRWRVRARAAAGDGPAADGPLTLVELEPVTGRSHQLRVHLAWLGCPIVGDRLYGRDPQPSAILALRAVSLTLPHPRTGASLALRAEDARGSPWHLFGDGRPAAGSADDRP